MDFLEEGQDFMQNLDFQVSDPADPNKIADANIFHFHIKFPTFSSNYYFWVKVSALMALFCSLLVTLPSFNGSCNLQSSAFS